MNAGERYSKPIGNELSNAAERMLEVLYILEAHDGMWVSQQGLRLWLGGNWSTHRINMMRKLQEGGYIEKVVTDGINLFTLTDSCTEGIKRRIEGTLLWRTPQVLALTFMSPMWNDEGQKAVSK